MPSTSIPELQQKLFRRIGIEAPVQPSNPKTSQRWSRSKATSRKDTRKAQRVEKKANRYQRQREPLHRPLRPSKPSNLQNNTLPAIPRIARDAETGSRATRDSGINGEDDGHMQVGSDDDVDFDGFSSTEDESALNPEPKQSVPKAIQNRLAEDDAEIEAFEKKLGIKKDRKSLPQAFKEDGLDELLGDLGRGPEEGHDLDAHKRKRDYDDWLSSKRKKMEKPKSPNIGMEQEYAKDVLDSEDDGLAEDSDLYSDDIDFNGSGQSIDEFESVASDGDNAIYTVPKRENPYVAPTNGAAVSKYVPPSLRRTADSESEQRNRLQRNIQGQVNRLTDANILSIVQAVEGIYQTNARGDVTEIVTNIILAQVCKPESLPEQFFVLTGGFTAALYKIIGSSFGSHIVHRVVQELSNDYQKAGKIDVGESGIRKEACNLANFLAQLYVFEVVSCRIIFDYMERFLSELSELNVELLLRICRMAGRLLRRDDPQALKHISGVLNRNLSKIGTGDVSVRTKFMVETINDLKNSKPRGKNLDSAIVSEHVIRMKKRIGELKSQSRRFDGLAPMGVSLGDMEGADTKGKWWLIGASVPVASRSKTGDTNKSMQVSEGELTDDEDMDFILPDYPQKARSQGFSSAAQIAIFSALMSATNCEHAYRQYLNLKLKRDDQLEIVRVLVQCVGSEADYNQFYALVASQACSNNRLRFAFQDRLWKIFRGLGESLFGEEADDEETADAERMKDSRRLANVARFYAALVADGSLNLSILKPLELPELNPWAADFIEWLLVSLLRLCRDKGSAEDEKTSKVFGSAKQAPAVAAGLYWFLRKKLRRSKLMEHKDGKNIERVRQKALVAVQALDAPSL